MPAGNDAPRAEQLRACGPLQSSVPRKPSARIAEHLPCCPFNASSQRYKGPTRISETATRNTSDRESQRRTGLSSSCRHPEYVSMVRGARLPGQSRSAPVRRRFVPPLTMLSRLSRNGWDIRSQTPLGLRTAGFPSRDKARSRHARLAVRRYPHSGKAFAIRRDRSGAHSQPHRWRTVRRAVVCQTAIFQSIDFSRLINRDEPPIGRHRCDFRIVKPGIRMLRFVSRKEVL